MTTMTTSVNIGKKPDPVTLSDIATTKVAELLAQEEGESLALRVAVKPGGCSGYSYEMFFDSETLADDVVREFGAVKVVVDAASAELLTGSTLDYSDEQPALYLGEFVEFDDLKLKNLRQFEGW